jgi:hypothetical protein
MQYRVPGDKRQTRLSVPESTTLSFVDRNHDQGKMDMASNLITHGKVIELSGLLPLHLVTGISLGG